MPDFGFLDWLNVPSWSIDEYLTVGCCVVNLLLFTPTMCYYVFKFNQRRMSSEYMNYYNTRNLHLAQIFIILSFYYVSIHTVLLCIIHFQYQESPWTEYFSDFVVISFIFSIFVLKHWKLYFDYMRSMSQLDFIWKRQINEEYSNWYLSHQRLGSATFCFWFIVFPIYLLLNASL